MYVKSAYIVVQIFPGVLQMIMWNAISSYSRKYLHKESMKNFIAEMLYNCSSTVSKYTMFISLWEDMHFV